MKQLIHDLEQGPTNHCGDFTEHEKTIIQQAKDVLINGDGTIKQRTTILEALITIHEKAARSEEAFYNAGPS